MLLTDTKWMSWKPSPTIPTARDYHFKVRYRHSDFNSNAKSMGLDDQMMASMVTGLIEDYKGASNFINYHSNPEDATLTFIWSAISWEESYKDLRAVVLQNVADFPANDRVPDATHLVVGVFYGAQIYCAISFDEESKLTKGVANEHLTNLWRKLKEALDRNVDVDKFKKELEKTKYFCRLTCRIYSDFQTEPLLKCSPVDLYQRCLDLQHQISNNGIKSGRCKGVPIAIQLCPLKILFQSTEMSKLFPAYRDVDVDFVNRSAHLLADLRQIVVKAKDVYAFVNKESSSCTIPEFIDVISNYQQLMQLIWRNSVVKARSQESFYGPEINKFENHPIFKLSYLKQWLMWKEEELKMKELIISRSGNLTRIGIENLSEQLENFLSSSAKKYCLVLFVPSLGEWTDKILVAMKKCLDDPNLAYWSSDIFNTKYERPWSFESHNRKLVLDWIFKFSNYVKKNREIASQVEFVITFGGKQFDCSFSIYETGKLLKGNLRQLPVAPIRLQIRPIISKKSSISTKILWEYEEVDCHFVIEYRMKGSAADWTRETTTELGQTNWIVPSGSPMEIRVAAVTCVGQSEFSDVVFSDSEGFSPKKSKMLQPPTGLQLKSVSATTAELEWTTPPGDFHCVRYRVEFWKKEENQLSSTEQETELDGAGCCLENLRPGTTYLLNVVSFVHYELTDSDVSETLEFTTGNKTRFVDGIVGRDEKMGNENGLDLFKIPLSRLMEGTGSAKNHFVFGSCRSPDKCRRTILLVGDSSSGKTSLINAMANYVFAVDSVDPFRLQLTEGNENDKVTVYDINHHESFRVDYSLTIIDAPGYVDKDVVQNQEITKTIGNFFSDENGIQQVDVVGFVVDSSVPELAILQSFIYSSLISIFGNGVKENIKFLLTSADQEDPFFWNDVVQTGMADWNQRCTVDTTDHLKSFFSSLGGATAKSTSLSKQLVDGKRRLETTLDLLINRVTMETSRLKQLRKAKKTIGSPWFNSNEANGIHLTVAQKVRLSVGQYVTNCNLCKATCHLNCGARKDKFDCAVMDHSKTKETRICLVCNCPWNAHANQLFHWDFSKVKQPLTFESFKKMYDDEDELSTLELVDILGEDISKKTKHLVELIGNVLNLVQRLHKIFQHLHQTRSTQQWIDAIKIVIIQIIELDREERPDQRPEQQRRSRELVYTLKQLYRSAELLE